MSIDRLERVNALIKREIGESLFHIMNDQAFDLAAVTVTHVITSRNLRTARVLVSIRGDEEKKTRMLGLLRRRLFRPVRFGPLPVLKYKRPLTAT